VGTATDGFDGRPVVWHVTEAMGGGISTAIHHFVRSTPRYSHHLVCSLRPQHQTGEDGGFASIRHSGRPGPLGLALLLAAPLDLPEPDIVHVHSTWSGLIARLLLARYRARIVYSPHAYYFERTDLPAAVRFADRILERMLAPLTRVVVAVSPHEARLAESLGTPARFVPNAAVLRGPPRGTVRTSRSSVPRLVTVGRVDAQKDPRFFAETVAAVRAAGTEIGAVWVGAGSRELEEVLRWHGIAVTGWVDRARVLAELRSADVYVHTAAWEGNPLTVLEAEALGLPCAVRSTPAMTSLGHPPYNDTPARLAEAVLRLLAGEPPLPKPAPIAAPVGLADVYADLCHD
jgi:glycosyltransferase involved in cell wall biosynthesis